MSGGTYCLKSTGDDRFLKNFSWQYYSKCDLLVGPYTPVCRFYGLIFGWVGEEKIRRSGNEFGCFFSRCVWPAMYSKRTGWLLGLDKACLRLVVGLSTGHCEISMLR